MCPVITYIRPHILWSNERRPTRAGGRPGRAGQLAVQMRMLHTGEAVPYLRPPRHTLCSGHLARAPPPQHLELLDVELDEQPRSFHNLRARRTPRRCERGADEVRGRRGAREGSSRREICGAMGTVNCSGGWQRRQLRDKDIQRRKVVMPAGVSRRGRGVPGPSEFLFEASDSHPSCAGCGRSG